MKTEQPRPLSAVEHSVLALLLSTEFPDAEVLRLQARSAMVVRGCECGCPSIALSVAPSAPRATLAHRLAPSEGVITPIGDEPPGQILLFVDDGRLSYLEYVYFDDTPPTTWPMSERIRVIATVRK